MISRAKTLDGEMVEGYYFFDDTHYIDDRALESCVKIDYQTLEYKIGDEWYSMEELLGAMQRHEEYKETWRVFGKTFENLKDNK